QGYDAYGVAYSEGRSVLNIAGLVLAPDNTNQVIQPIVLDSQGVGWWRRVVDRASITAELHLAVPLSPAERAAMEAAFARYSAFAGVPVELA
ncbi:DNA glycosylase AlkZ-like family protein, partial [Cellulomonas rhizosphaerae]